MTSRVQLQGITAQLSDYFSALSAWLADPGQTLPSFEDYTDTVGEFDQLLNDSVDTSDRSASFSHGAASDTVHLSMSVDREFSLRKKTKGFYWADAQSETAKQAEIMTDMWGEYFNYMRGSSVAQINDV